MAKLLLVSILVLTVAVPIAAARAPSADLALRRLGWWMVAGIGAYALAIMYVYPRVLS